MTSPPGGPAPSFEPEDAPGAVRVRRVGTLGHLTLDRLARINALTLDMIVRIRAVLVRWETDPRVEQVLLDGAGERGFCAGGDIRVVHDSARDRTGAADHLWRQEYLLDALIGDYRKPVVVVLDGIAMGGGIGLGGHASHRIVSERSVLAMPEVRIGLSPDVGGTLLFARAPGHLGTHLAMTGERFGPGDAIHLGIADTLVPSGRLPELAALLAEGTADDVVAALREPAPEAPLASAREWADDCYAPDSALDILARLRGSGHPDAKDAAERIEAVSPTAVCVARQAVARAGRLESRPDPLPDVLAQDLRVGLRLLEGTDPVEGIRAIIIDKSHRPCWSPRHVAELNAEHVDRHFAKLGDEDLNVRAEMRCLPMPCP